MVLNSKGWIQSRRHCVLSPDIFDSKVFQSPPQCLTVLGDNRCDKWHGLSNCKTVKGYAKGYTKGWTIVGSPPPLRCFVTEAHSPPSVLSTPAPEQSSPHPHRLSPARPPPPPQPPSHCHAIHQPPERLGARCRSMRPRVLEEKIGRHDSNSFAYVDHGTGTPLAPRGSDDNHAISVCIL